MSNFLERNSGRLYDLSGVLTGVSWVVAGVVVILLVSTIGDAFDRSYGGFENPILFASWWILLINTTFLVLFANVVGYGGRIAALRAGHRPEHRRLVRAESRHEAITEAQKAVASIGWDIISTTNDGALTIARAGNDDVRIRVIERPGQAEIHVTSKADITAFAKRLENALANSNQG